MPSVLVTGAGRGLGLEFARQYAGLGWNVIATVRSASDGGDDVPADLGLLPREFQPYAAAGAGNEDARHQSNRLETELSSAIRRIASASRGAMVRMRILSVPEAAS